VSQPRWVNPNRRASRALHRRSSGVAKADILPWRTRSMASLTDRPEGASFARAAGLIYTSDRQPGIRRVGRPKRFRYLHPRGRPVTSKASLGRIRSLVIPPAWADVWISATPRGHLQATGRDARGRKQYRYHPKWREVRDSTKYGRMADFARA